MYFQQRKAILLEHELGLHLPYKHYWKQVTLPISLQSELGADKGDIVIVRPDMLAKTAACVIVGTGPQKDFGNNVVRVSSDIKRVLKTSIGYPVLIEKIDVIPADEIKIEWFIPSLTKKYIDPNVRESISKHLIDLIIFELSDLPLMRADRFSTTLSLPDPEHNYKINYWIRSYKPGFPVVKINSDTQIILY